MTITVTEHPSSCASSRLYLVNIHNLATVNTTVTAHPAVAHYWLRFILRRPRLVFALGVHFSPSTITATPAATNDPPAATLHISVHHYCLIFQLRHAVYCPRILRWVLSHPRATFVGLYTDVDFLGLLHSRHGLRMCPGMPMDLWPLLARGRRVQGGFVAEIAMEAIGVDMEWDWDVCRSDFSVEVLSVGQVKHAVVYGYVCYEIGVRNRAWMYNPRLFG